MLSPDVAVLDSGVVVLTEVLVVVSSDDPSMIVATDGSLNGASDSGSRGVPLDGKS